MKNHDSARILRDNNIFFITNNNIFIKQVNILSWRASKQFRSTKLIPVKQCATKSLPKRYGIDFGGYAQPFWLFLTMERLFWRRYFFHTILKRGSCVINLLFSRWQVPNLYLPLATWFCLYLPNYGNSYE